MSFSKKDGVIFYIYLIVFVVFLWNAVTISIQRFKCVEMTQTELLLNTFNSFCLNFKKCN